MSMKLLPASVNPPDPPVLNESNSLVPLAQRAITVQTGQISVPSADAFTWSSQNRSGGVKWIDATPVEDSESDDPSRTAVEYLSGWARSGSMERTAIAHYLSYAAGLVTGTGRFLNVYA